MKVLLDENLPHALRRVLPGHEVVTASYAGFAGYTNGTLLGAAVKAGFSVLVTGDKTLDQEQNLARYDIGIVLLSANAWRIVRQHVDEITAAIEASGRGTVIRVDCQ